MLKILSLNAYLYNNKKISIKDSIRSVATHGRWRTRRYVLDGNEGTGFYWDEDILGCSNDDNMTPKGDNNEK